MAHNYIYTNFAYNPLIRRNYLHYGMDGGFCQGGLDENFGGSCLSGKRLADAGGALRGGAPQSGAGARGQTFGLRLPPLFDAPRLALGRAPARLNPRRNTFARFRRRCRAPCRRGARSRRALRRCPPRCRGCCKGSCGNIRGAGTRGSCASR